MRVCIYGSARDTINEEYLKEGEELGELLAYAGYSLVFGAGKTGMMGAVNRGILKAGGRSIGVTPTFMKEFEPVGNCTEIVYTDTMHARKKTMESLGDAFIITPGGIGTMDEFFSIITQKQLKQNVKPIVILNYDGCFDSLINMLNDMVDEKFMTEETLQLYTVVESAKDAVDYLLSVEAKR